ncbi:MAG: hypothetical protein JO007_07145 [Alphaproteobacteria bacterium]|nr:hypothetical protein [Alphaproteobacteria bacterium]
MGCQKTTQSALQRVLKKVRALAEDIRRTAERVHEETEESYRLAQITREELAKSRDLSRSGQREADTVHGTIKRSLDAARNSGRLTEPKD